MTEVVRILQGGEAVRALVHDCGTVCLYRVKYAEPPYPPYMLLEPWCPTCKVVVEDPGEVRRGGMESE